MPVKGTLLSDGDNILNNLFVPNIKYKLSALVLNLKSNFSFFGLFGGSAAMLAQNMIVV